MRPFGFSTGALAKGAFHEALAMLTDVSTTAIELSALRENELLPLIQSLSDLDLADYEHISLHLPSRFQQSEDALVEQVYDLPDDWLLIIHPDAIENEVPWRRLGARLCVENMDGRKPIGRTVDELSAVLSGLPEASLCFDVAHACHYDPSLGVADAIVDRFYDRIKQLHVSVLNDRFGHELLLEPAPEFVGVYLRRLAHVPVILETPVAAAGLFEQLSIVKSVSEG